MGVQAATLGDATATIAAIANVVVFNNNVIPQFVRRSILCSLAVENLHHREKIMLVENVLLAQIQPTSERHI